MGIRSEKPVYLLTVENGQFKPLAKTRLVPLSRQRALSRRWSAQMTDPIVLLQILWTGAVTASIFVLLTLAFSLTQKVTGLWNFAQAGTMGIAFYAMYFVLNDLPCPWSSRWLSRSGYAPACCRPDAKCGVSTCCARDAPSSLMFFIFTLILARTRASTC